MPRFSAAPDGPVKCYCISSIIKRSFSSLQNNPKNLDPSYKMDLDLWDCLDRVKLILKA